MYDFNFIFLLFKFPVRITYYFNNHGKLMLIFKESL